MWKTTQNVYGQKQSEGKKVAQQQLLQALRIRRITCYSDKE